MIIKRLTLDALTWTPIVAPVDCQQFGLSEDTLSSAIKLRSDPTDSTTEMTLPAGYQGKVITPPAGATRSNFAKNQIIVYAQSPLGTITAVATFV